MNTLPPRQTRRRFPLKPRSVRTPPARYTLMPATEATWKTETITLTQANDGSLCLNSDDCFSLTGGLHENFKDWPLSLDISQVLGFIQDRRIKNPKDKFWYGQIKDDTWTISLRYQVLAQPARKEPRPLSKKLKA